jgi:hypothetical protein
VSGGGWGRRGVRPVWTGWSRCEAVLLGSSVGKGWEGWRHQWVTVLGERGPVGKGYWGGGGRVPVLGVAGRTGGEETWRHGVEEVEAARELVRGLRGSFLFAPAHRALLRRASAPHA